MKPSPSPHAAERASSVVRAASCASLSAAITHRSGLYNSCPLCRGGRRRVVAARSGVGAIADDGRGDGPVRLALALDHA
jgi:hypothetical protein